MWRCGLGLRADTAGQGSVHPVLPTPGPMGSFPAPWRTADPLATETTATSRAATVTAPSQPSGTSLSWGLPPPALFCLLPPRGLRSRQGLSDARQTWAWLGTQLLSSGAPLLRPLLGRCPAWLGLRCRGGGDGNLVQTKRPQHPEAWVEPLCPAPNFGFLAHQAGLGEERRPLPLSQSSGVVFQAEGCSFSTVFILIYTREVVV